MYVNRFFGLALAIILVYLGFLLSVFSDLNTKTAPGLQPEMSHGPGWKQGPRQTELGHSGVLSTGSAFSIFP